MTASQKTLLELIKSVLHPDVKASISNDVNWREVYEESKKHNLIAFSWDAVEKLQRAGGFETGDNENLQMLVMQWYGMSNLSHRRYEEYQKTIQHLAQFFKSNGLRMLIMKGYGCSLDYPNPKSRPCGDIDIWMFGKQEEADEIIRKNLSIGVGTDNEHHSTYIFEGTMVENHGTIQDENIHRSESYINKVLEQLACVDIRGVDVGGVIVDIPSVKFNSIHLLRHMACDFATFTTSLRHVLDWSTFVSKHSEQIDWNFVREVAHRANMHKFLDSVNSICVDYLGYSADLFPVEHRDEKLRERVFDDIMNNHAKPDLPDLDQSFLHKIKYGMYKTSRMWKNRWKYKIVYDESLLESFWTLATNRLRN